MRRNLKIYGGIFDIDSKEKTIKELEYKSQESSFWDNSANAKKSLKELDALKELVNSLNEQSNDLKDIEAIYELLKDSDDKELNKEAETKLMQVEKVIEAIEFKRMLSGENDSNSAILSINSGAGGTEACDWAEMLLRMYRRWAELHGFKNELVEFTSGDEAGFKSVTMTIEGKYAYGYLKAERGVHRLVRISPFDSNKRRHTSFASVDVLPDIEEDIEIEINESDLRVDTFRSSGAGGQHVNKTDSAVRLTHLPTGIAVACQKERSQHRNKDIAMKLLKAKLYEREMEKKRKERDAYEDSKSDIAWGSQIRSYVMHPYRMVKDHRTNMEIGNVESVMDGNIDGFIQKFLMSV